MISATGIVCGSTGRLNWSVCRFTTFLPREKFKPQGDFHQFTFRQFYLQRTMNHLRHYCTSLHPNPHSSFFFSNLKTFLLIEIQSLIFWILKEFWFIVVWLIDWLIDWGKNHDEILPPRTEPGVEAQSTQPISSAWLQFLRMNFSSLQCQKNTSNDEGL